jgi:hypothetical protein
LTVFDNATEPDTDAKRAAQTGKVVAYCGTFAANHDMNVLAAATGHLFDSTGLGFLFVGPTHDEIVSLLGPRALDRRIFCTGRVPHGRVPALLACADLYWAALANDRGRR